jgi:hypothetical protein
VMIDGVDTSSLASAEVHPDDDEMPDEDDYTDLWDDDDADTGETQLILPRSAADMMNDPSVWG